jgi:aryl-alcohol dehydrogenase-like predicted oxidoreductase
MGFKNRAELCLAFVLSQDWVHRVVIGIETEDQLQENLQLIHCRQLTPEECAAIVSQLPKVPNILLDPSQWPLTTGEG